VILYKFKQFVWWQFRYCTFAKQNRRNVWLRIVASDGCGGNYCMSRAHWSFPHRFLILVLAVMLMDFICTDVFLMFILLCMMLFLWFQYISSDTHLNIPANLLLLSSLLEFQYRAVKCPMHFALCTVVLMLLKIMLHTSMYWIHICNRSAEMYEH
jgi:hypothetical protein